MEELISHWVSVAGLLVEALGVLIVLLAALVSTGWFLWQLRLGSKEAYRDYRHLLGRGVLLGLEFLVAGDIIRTVAVSPTLTSVAVLGGVVLIRTFLSMTLEMELEGRWPWQRSRARDSG